MAVLVRYWLHKAPADDLDAFVGQVAQAKWMEDRMWQTFATIMSKAIGGK